MINLSGYVSNRLLYLFALADTRVRVTQEMSRPEEVLHLFRMTAEENGCFDQPYPFANDHAQFLFHRNALSSLHYVSREEYACTVTLMSGLPGAGKDTWLHQSVLFSQNARRAKQVPRRVMGRLIDKLEPPTKTEAHAVYLYG